MLRFCLVLNPVLIFQTPIIIRSCDLDEWTAEQLEIMKLSGNGNAANFFKRHGVTDEQMRVSPFDIFLSF